MMMLIIIIIFIIVVIFIAVLWVLEPIPGICCSGFLIIAVSQQSHQKEIKKSFIITFCITHRTSDFDIHFTLSSSNTHH